MPNELFACFFCGRPILPGENISGVICDAPFCQKFLAEILRSIDAELQRFYGRTSSLNEGKIYEIWYLLNSARKTEVY